MQTRRIKATKKIKCVRKSFTRPGNPQRVGVGLYNVGFQVFIIDELTEDKVYDYFPTFSSKVRLAVINDSGKMEYYPAECFASLPNSYDFINE